MTNSDNRIIFSKNLRFYLEHFDKTQTDLVKDLNFRQATVSDWLTAKKFPRIDKIEMLANYFGIEKSDLIEERSSRKYSTNLSVQESASRYSTLPAYQFPRRINVYGRIPAGVPLEAVPYVIDWEEIPDNWTGDYIALQVKGDSMEPEYREKDVIIIRVQPDCESGQDCAVYVNGYDATLKRVIKQSDCIMLQPLNHSYEPKVYNYNDEDGVTILGVVVEMRRKKN